jgi:hypothetical protein
MQNGKAALSIIGYNYKKQITPNQIIELLKPIYRDDDTDTEMSNSLFYPIRHKINKIGISKFFHTQLTKMNESENFSCNYCGKLGASALVSYIFPFITTLKRYPNIYSMGKIQSLNFCSRCMLISFAANSRWLFNVRSPLKSKTDFFSAIMFFSNNEIELRRFYRNFTERNLLPSWYTNIEILPQEFVSDSDNDNNYNETWFPEEFLALLVYFISRKIKRFNIVNKNLGAVLLSYNRTFSGMIPTTIYNSFDIVNDLFPFIKGVYNLSKNTKNENSFLILFKHLKKDVFSNQPDDYIFRGQFFRQLLLNRKFDWKTIQSIIMLKATEDKSIPFLKSFIITMCNELSLNLEKAAFSDGNKIGYNMGVKIKKNLENPKRLKKYIFDFRRCRRPKDFLSLLNLVQAQSESAIYDADIFVDDKFEIAKTGFLIGFSNAIFIKQKEQRDNNNTDGGK